MNEARLSDIETAAAGACGATCPMDPEAPPCRECSYFRLFAAGAHWSQQRAAKLLRKRANHVYYNLPWSPHNATLIGEFRAAAAGVLEMDE